MKNAKNANANINVNSTVESPAFKRITTYLKTGETVVIDNVPCNIESALQAFGNEKRLIDSAINYVVAHSLLAKARKLVADGKHKVGENINLNFEPPMERGTDKPQTIKLNKLKGDNRDIETFKLMAEKLGLKFA